MARMTLEAARRNVKLTQKEAADRLGVSNSTIHHWEKGISFPNVQQVDKICELYRVSYNDLIFIPDNSL